MTEGGAPPTWDDPSAGWTPPPPPGGRPGWLVPLIVLAVMIGVGLLGVASVLVVRSTGGAEVPVAVQSDVMSEEAEPGVPVDPPAVGDPGIDPGDVQSPEDAVTKALLTAIDEAEVTMISFGVESRDGVDADGVLLEGGAVLVADAATRGADQLQVLRDRMTDLESVDPDAITLGLATIRDGYVAHLDAWRAWMEAVRDDPTLLEFDNNASAPFSKDIADTAEVFVDELRIGLPEDTSAGLREFAQFIIDRGFGGSGDGGDLV